MRGINFFYHADVTVSEVVQSRIGEERTSLLSLFPYFGRFYGEEKDLFCGIGVGVSHSRQVSDQGISEDFTNKSSLFSLNIFARRYYPLHEKLAVFGQLLTGGGFGTLKTEADIKNDARLWSFQIVGSPGVH